MDKEKDSREFFRLYTGVQKQLYAYLLMLVHNHDDAEDLLQETAGILWEKFDEFIEGSSFAAWAMGIARNRALDLMKLRRRSRPYFEDSVYEKLYIQAELTSDDTSQRANALRNCIKKLSEPNRKMIYQRFDREIPFKKLSQQTGESTTVLYKRMSRIYRMLRECVDRTIVGINE